MDSGGVGGMLNLHQRKEAGQRTKLPSPNSQQINTGKAAKAESRWVKSHCPKQGS
jgi:hypothetical protein